MFTAVTTMEKITFLVKKLQSSASSNPNLTDLVFLKGEFFSWDHTTHTITFNPSDPLANAYLLHEFGHALLGHADYSHDIELLQIERAAWDKAVKIAKEYEVSLDSDTVEDSLDTYRDWLHDRSQSVARQASKLALWYIDVLPAMHRGGLTKPVIARFDATLLKNAPYRERFLKYLANLLLVGFFCSA